MRKTILFLAVITLSLTIFGQHKSIAPELLQLVESERAFSRTCAEKGIRASFMEFFADEGISFTPHPGNAQERFRSRPAPANPQPFTMTWEPVFAGIARSGELGYTTGPVVSVDNSTKQPLRYAYYFSIWKKQPDNSWKVLVDYGIETPAPNEAQTQSFVAATSDSWRSTKKVDLEQERSGLMLLERRVSDATNKGNVSQALAPYLVDESRIHRNGLTPIINRKAIAAYLDQEKLTRLQYEPYAAGVSDSADLGYTYGKYELVKQSLGTAEKGYSVHVWKRNKAGDWKLVADIANALPLN